MSELQGAEWTLSSEKRVFDLLGMTALLPAVLPAAAIAAAAIKSMDNMDPVFVQSRLGLDLQPFDIYKFRTMPADTPETPSLGSSSDPRATRLGKILRKGHVDELPQSVNVYNGTFSLVGLRALIRRDVEDTLEVLSPSEQIEWKEARRTARPAVFGPFQLEQHVSEYGKGEINYRRAMSDINYAKTATFKGDLDIIKRTALEGLGFNALFVRDLGERKRGQRGADMLMSVANGMGITVSEDEVQHWRVVLLAARTVDNEVDNANLISSSELVTDLIGGNPVGDMTALEAKEFSDIFAKLPARRQARLSNSFLVLPNLLSRKKSATTAKELLAINATEAQIFAAILELESVDHNPQQQQVFNDWLAKFSSAGYMTDTFLDVRKDFEAGNLSLSPSKLRRAAFGVRAAREITRVVKVTPIHSYPSLIVSSVRTLAK
ncbi:sugar transferase [Polaromonas sp.]|nr:sugar transferase [Candidatus Saccharibacteria bacterium]